MIYRLKGRRVPRIKVPQRDGSQVTRSVGSHDPDVIADVEAMVRQLKRKRRWDAFDAIGKRSTTLIKLLDAYRVGDEAIDALLARADDVDLEPFIVKWQGWLRQRQGEDTQQRYPMHVRTLIPEGQPFNRSDLTPARVEGWLSTLTRNDGQPMASGTVRRYHAALSSFVGYLRRINVLESDPMATVDAPPPGDPRCVYLTLPEVRRLLDMAPEPYRSLYAVMYGTGIEVSTAIRLKRRDVQGEHIHAKGTKRQRGKVNHRDRMVRVATWALPFVAELVKGKLPDARLFPEINDRSKASKLHLKLAEEIGRPEVTLHDSRHHWAVRKAKAGTPAEVIATQLGHADPVMVLRVYGRFRPSGEERDRWEKIAALQDETPESASK